MSEASLQQTLYRLLSILSVVSGIGFGSYSVYASLFGNLSFPFAGDLWWAGFGVLIVIQSVWHLGTTG
jgi:hypothetical protein